MTEASSGRPEFPVLSGDVRVITGEISLAWLSLDLEESPFARPAQAFPSAVTCPLCHGVTALPEGGSDDELTAFWEHLRTHNDHPLVLIQLWVTAMERAR